LISINFEAPPCPPPASPKSGAIELSADLRQCLSLLEGDEAVLEERDGGLFLRPVIDRATA